MKSPPGALTVDIARTGKQWDTLAPERLCRRAAKAAYAAVPRRRKPEAKAELAILLTSDAAIRRLNARYRQKDKPTDVLSFPAWSPGEPHPGGGIALGDVVIAYGTSARDAKAEAKPLGDHVMHLVVHGVLHLLGYDHMRDDDAAAMERLEIAVLKKLGVANPYESRAPSPSGRPNSGRPRRKRP
jgi:probable rRNA maturation factor